jgi:hypothetical protein
MSIKENIDTISIDLSKPNCHRYLAGNLHRLKFNEKRTCVVIKGSGKECSSALPAFPNICVPVAAVIQYYQSNQFHIKCDWDDCESYISSTRASNPLLITENVEFVRSHPLDIVWKFESSDGVQVFVDALQEYLSSAFVAVDGLLEGLIWNINEVMDNVIQHSEISCGYVMGQLTNDKNHLSICVFDNGIGILNSFKGSQYRPEKSSDAITLALKRGVTRDSKIGQGNGLWGLSEILKANNGSLTIKTGGGQYSVSGSEAPRINNLRLDQFYMSCDKLTTMIDFQLNNNKSICLDKIFNNRVPVQLWLEGMENSDGEHVIQLSEEKWGTGTRSGAQKIRNEAENVLIIGKTRVVFDFTDVYIVSSSFSDELFGKLIEKYGFIGFQKAFRITNTSEINEKIINKSVSMRMAELSK